MRCEFQARNVIDPFAAIRRDFERQIQTNANKGVMPLSVLETEGGVEIAFDVPGVPEDSVEVVIHEGILHISAERSLTVPEGAKEVFSNRASGSFKRSLKLDDSIDPDSVDAVINNGVLTVSMKRREELQPKRVTVRQAA